MVGVEEDSTAAVAADFMAAAGQRFMEVEVSAAESTLRMSVDAGTPDIMAAITEGGATTADITAVTAGAWLGRPVLGPRIWLRDGAGDLALAGRIGVGDGDIPMAITTAPGITGLDLIILTLLTVLRAIPRAIRIKATGTTILIDRSQRTATAQPERTRKIRDATGTGRHTQYGLQKHGRRAAWADSVR